MTSWLVTAPTVEPLSLADAKAQCRIVDSVTDEDDVIWSLIPAVREWGESFTGRAFLPQTWDIKFDAFPSCIVLPKPPVSSVTSISYVDTTGATQVLSSSLYTASLPTGPFASPGTIVPAYGLTWPSTRSVPDAVTVRIVCGYADVETVPKAIVSALKVRLGTLYAYREGIVVGTSVLPIPGGAAGAVPIDEYLLWPYKVFL